MESTWPRKVSRAAVSSLYAPISFLAVKDQVAASHQLEPLVQLYTRLPQLLDQFQALVCRARLLFPLFSLFDLFTMFANHRRRVSWFE